MDVCLLNTHLEEWGSVLFLLFFPFSLVSFVSRSRILVLLSLKYLYTGANPEQTRYKSQGGQHEDDVKQRTANCRIW